MSDSKMDQDRTTNPNPKGKTISTKELAQRAAPFDKVTPEDFKNLDDFQKDRTTGVHGRRTTSRAPERMMGGGHVKKYNCGGEVKKYSHGGMNCPHRQDGVRGGGIAQRGMKFSGTS